MKQRLLSVGLLDTVLALLHESGRASGNLDALAPPLKATNSPSAGASAASGAPTTASVGGAGGAGGAVGAGGGSGGGGASSSRALPVSTDHSTDRTDATGLPIGRKVELVRLVANMAYRCRVVQDALRLKGGLPVMLNHCNIDGHHPMLREWGIFAIRNLCGGNLENQVSLGTSLGLSLGLSLI